MDKKQITVGAKEGLGAGIVALGVLLIFTPSFSQKVADLDFVSSEAFGVLTGTVLVLAVITMLAGLAVIFSKFDDEE